MAAVLRISVLATVIDHFSPTHRWIDLGISHRAGGAAPERRPDGVQGGVRSPVGELRHLRTGPLSGKLGALSDFRASGRLSRLPNHPRRARDSCRSGRGASHPFPRQIGADGPATIPPPATVDIEPGGPGGDDHRGTFGELRMLPSGRVRSAPLFGSAVLMWGSTCRPETAGRSKTRRWKLPRSFSPAWLASTIYPRGARVMVLRDVAAAPGARRMDSGPGDLPPAGPVPGPARLTARPLRGRRRGAGRARPSGARRAA